MATIKLSNTGTVDHPIYGPVNYRVEDIGYDANGQVARTLGVMGERVREDARDPQFCSWAQHVIGSKPGTLDDMAVIGTAYYHVKGALRFQRDEVTGTGVGNYPAEEVVEVIIRPREMAKFIQSGGVGVGDCDDYTMYLAGILECYGIPTEFCTVAADARSPESFSHVYLVAYPVDRESGKRFRVPLDASHGEYPGWEVESGGGRKKQWPVSSTGGVMGWVGWLLVGVGAWLTLREARVI